jgi:hypothetical protein
MLQIIGSLVDQCRNRTDSGPASPGIVRDCQEIQKTHEVVRDQVNMERGIPNNLDILLPSLSKSTNGLYKLHCASELLLASPEKRWRH